MEETKTLNGSLAGADRRKLDEYLYSVREVEQQIQKAEAFPVKELPPGTVPPEGIPPEVPDHIKVMLDLTALAFQTDTTRIASVMFAVGGSDRAFPFLGISSSHHHYSHHEKKPENLDALNAIDKFYVSQFGYLVRKLKSIPEGAGSVLDSCLLLYGSPLRDGNLHDRGDLPILLAGSGGGAITPGRAIKYAEETPLANLHLNLLAAFGIQEQRFSDSTGRLASLIKSLLPRGMFMRLGCVGHIGRVAVGVSDRSRLQTTNPDFSCRADSHDSRIVASIYGFRSEFR